MRDACFHRGAVAGIELSNIETSQRQFVTDQQGRVCCSSAVT